MELKYKLFFDGACWPNPGGVGSYGFVLQKNTNNIAFGYGVIGQTKQMSDAIAEFYALGAGLQRFLCLIDCANPCLEICGDSRLVLDFCTHKSRKEYNFIERRAVEFHLTQIRELKCKLIFTWIPRKENQAADYLSRLIRTHNV